MITDLVTCTSLYHPYSYAWLGEEEMMILGRRKKQGSEGVTGVTRGRSGALSRFLQHANARTYAREFLTGRST